MSSHTVNLERWSKLTVFEQMGNVGAEVGRALTAKRQGNKEALESALYRGLDLLDATAQLSAQRNPAETKEILRAREQFVEAATTSKSDPALETYFMHFAMAARLQR